MIDAVISPSQDQLSRTRALDPGASFIIQAPAGSGKTELLIQRYLRLLVTVDQCSKVLAVTFTKKAAGEMRHRIHAALDRAQQPEPPAQPHQQLTWRLARAVFQHAVKLHWPTEHIANQLTIMTIDACCQYFLSFAGPTYKAYSQFTLHPQPQLLYTAVIARFIKRYCSHRDARHYHDFSALMLDQYHDYRQVERLLLDALANREKWLRLTLEAKTQNYRQMLTRNVERCQAAHLETLLDHFEHQLLFSLQHTLSSIARLNSLMALPSDFDLLGRQSPTCWLLSEWQTFVQLICTKNGQWRRRLNQKNGIANQSSLKQLSESDRQDYLQHKEDLYRHIETLCQHPDLSVKLLETLEIPILTDPETEWQSLEPLLAIMPSLVAYLQMEMEYQKTTDFSGINLKLLSALLDENDAHALTLQIYQHYQHLLIDEFQDTSVSQFQIFELAFAPWQGEPHRSLCLVGDPMQSIYRFRQAEVKLFFQAQKDGFCGIALEPLQLTQNYRSSQTLVDNLNCCFKQLMTPRHNTFYPAQAVSDHSQSGLFWHDVEPDCSQSQAVCDQIKRLSSEHPQLSKCLLVRSRTQLRFLLPALQKNAITYTGVGIHSLGHSQSVLDLFCLMCLPLDFTDRRSWVGFLNSAAVALPMTDIHRLCQPKNMPIWDHMNTHFDCLSVHGQKVISRIKPVISEYLSHFGRKPLSHLAQYAWHQLGGDFACPTENDHDHCLLFIDLVRELEQSSQLINQASLHELLLTYPEQSTSSTDHDVQIMTIHKSKGLEFDIVLMPYLESSSPLSTKPLLDWTYTAYQSQLHLIMHSHPRHKSFSSPVHRYLRFVDKMAQHAEMERLYYVAFTRAKYQLHLFSARKDTYPERSIMHQLSSALDQPAMNLIKQHHAPVTQPKHTNQPLRPSRLVIPADWNHPIASRPIPNQSDTPHAVPSVLSPQSGSSKRCAYQETDWGQFVHRCMEFMLMPQAHNTIDRHKLIQLASLYAIDLSDEQQSLDILSRSFSKCFADPMFQWIKQYASQQFMIESTMIHDGQRLRVDCAFIDPKTNTLWVVDFKTYKINEFMNSGDTSSPPSQIEPKYLEQLQRYQAAYQALGLASSVSCALYYPLTQSWLPMPTM